jgi:hypothetical protein
VAEYPPYKDDNGQALSVQEADDFDIDLHEDENGQALSVKEADDFDINLHHKFINLSKVMIPQGGQIVTGRVARRKRDGDGNLIGRSHTNPFLDTSLNELNFEDRHTEAYITNLIAEHMYDQIDIEGRANQMMDEIVDQKRLNDTH